AQIMMEQVISEFEGQGKLFINIENGNTNVDVEHINILVELADNTGITTNDNVMEIREREKWHIDCITSIHEIVRNHQFTLAIDYFGTGFSNGTLLLQLEPKIIKVDRSLIQDINDDFRKQFYVESLVRFADRVDMKILCEGIETEEELD